MTREPGVRPLDPSDLEELVLLCEEHAEYERAPFSASGLHERLRGALFGPSPRAACWVVDGEEELAGFAVAAEEFSTWDGSSFVHLDCLFLRPAYRGRSLGRALLRRVASFALERGAANLQWQTPDWNVDAVRFYDRSGAKKGNKVRFTLAPEGCRRLTVGG